MDHPVTEIVIPPSTRGFDVLTFVSRAHDLFLRQRIGLVGIREIREQTEFEDSEPEGSA